MTTADADWHELRGLAHSLLTSIKGWPQSIEAANSRAHFAQVERALARCLLIERTRVVVRRDSVGEPAPAAWHPAPPRTPCQIDGKRLASGDRDL